jgi:hypothetical protein
MTMTKYLSYWWNKHGWGFIVISSILLLFILWIFNPTKSNASSGASMQNAMEMAFTGNLRRNFENTREIMDQMDRKSNPPQEFIYEEGASKGENMCRKIMEELTGMKFYKTRPDFMRNPVTGVFLELDCYNDSLKLAVEYNGEQHDKYNKFMHQGSMDKFRNQQYRDYIKKTLCKENGVFLIVVPHTIKIPDLKPFLMEKLKPFVNERIKEQQNITSQENNLSLP